MVDDLAQHANNIVAKFARNLIKIFYQNMTDFDNIMIPPGNSKVGAMNWFREQRL